MERRTGSRAGFESLADYRAAQAAAIVRRQAPAMRRAYWADKQAEAERAAEMEREAMAREAGQRSEAERRAVAVWFARFNEAKGN